MQSKFVLFCPMPFFTVQVKKVTGRGKDKNGFDISMGALNYLCFRPLLKQIEFCFFRFKQKQGEKYCK